jgi:hypothetical protein
VLKLILDDADVVNVARGRPASQSSTSQWSAPDESSRAVSGERHGSLAFHTDAEPQPWWLVDLERSYAIDAIVIWNRDDEFASRARTLRIELSLDGGDWQTVHRGITYFGGARTARPLIHLLNGQLRARYVRVSLEETVPLHLAQVEVWVTNSSLALERFWRELYAREPTLPSFVPATRKPRYVAVKGSVPGSDQTITALKIEPYGRFGNNFHQTLNAALLAKHLGIKTIIMPRGGLLGATPSGENAGIRFVHDGADDAQRALSGPFYFIDDFQACFERITLQEMLDVLNHAVRPQYRAWIERARTTEDGTMHFHFRSGDVFRVDTPHYTYLQPPLGYYKAALTHAIAHFGVKRAVIVYEDMQNPCVAAFMAHLTAQGIEYSACSGSLEDDVIELLGARIVCQSFGTFTESALCLSSNARVTYGFRDVEAFPGATMVRGRGIREILDAKRVAVHVIEDSEPRYLERDSWINSEEQREIMLSYPEERMVVTT